MKFNSKTLLVILFVGFLITSCFVFISLNKNNFSCDKQDKLVGGDSVVYYGDKIYEDLPSEFAKEAINKPSLLEGCKYHR